MSPLWQAAAVADDAAEMEAGGVSGHETDTRIFATHGRRMPPVIGSTPRFPLEKAKRRRCPTIAAMSGQVVKLL
jgi:hypothetical protein